MALFLFRNISDEGAFATISQNSDDSLDYANPIYYNQDYRKVEIESHSKAFEHDESNRKDFISQRGKSLTIHLL